MQPSYSRVSTPVSRQPSSMRQDLGFLYRVRLVLLLKTVFCFQNFWKQKCLGYFQKTVFEIFEDRFLRTRKRSSQSSSETSTGGTRNEVKKRRSPSSLLQHQLHSLKLTSTYIDGSSPVSGLWRSRVVSPVDDEIVTIEVIRLAPHPKYKWRVRKKTFVAASV